MGIVDNFKDVFKVADTLNNIDLYKKLGELQTRVMEVEEENRALKEELRSLKDQSKTDAELEVENNAYYLHRNGKKEGPFCMTCWDADRKLMRERLGATEGTHFCTYCRDARRRR